MRIFIFRHNKASVVRNRFGGEKRDHSLHHFGETGRKHRLTYGSKSRCRAGRHFKKKCAARKLQRALLKDECEEAQHAYRSAQAERYIARMTKDTSAVEIELAAIDELPADKANRRFNESSAPYQQVSWRRWIHGARILASRC